MNWEVGHHKRHWNPWWAWCLPLGFQDGKLLDADPPEELAPKDATCPSEDGSGRVWTTLGLHGWFVGPAEFSIHFSISRSSWATSCCDLMNGDEWRWMEMGNEWKRGDSEIQVVCFLKRAFFLCLSSWCRTGCLVGSKPAVLLNNFTHSLFFCPREVCQSSCEAAVAQVLVPSLEDQREARQGWWFQLGAVEKSFFLKKYFSHVVFPWLFKWKLQLFYCFAVALPRHNWTAPVRRCWSWCNSWIERPNMAEMVWKRVMQKVETEILGILARRKSQLANDPILPE